MAMATRAAKAARCVVTLPEEIIVWEILASLPPKPLLRCRAVCHAWRRATSTRVFLLAHHRRQPSLPLLRGFAHARSSFRNILAFDHRRGGNLHHVTRLQGGPKLEAACDGLLLLLSKYGTSRTRTICNPVTRQHATLNQLLGFRTVWGMYLHRPTGDHRILLHKSKISEEDQAVAGCYVFTLTTSDHDQHTARYIGGPGTASQLISDTPALLRDCLHWLLVRQCQGEGRLVLVFDTAAESFRRMRAPPVPGGESNVFEMDATLGVYGCNRTRSAVNIWVLEDYDGEVWERWYRVKLPIAEIGGRLGSSDEVWNVSVVSVDGDILLLVTHGGYMFYVDADGELVGSFRRDGQHLYDCGLQLKQSLVQHTFFPAVEGYDESSPFV